MPCVQYKEQAKGLDWFLARPMRGGTARTASQPASQSALDFVSYSRVLGFAVFFFVFFFPVKSEDRIYIARCVLRPAET